MLNLFRKYQKTLFAIVAVFTTASFIFFGSYSVMQSPTRAADFTIGKTLDGKNITSQQFQLLVRFITTSPLERQLFEKGGTPNLLNDGVIQKDFLETGFATMLAERHFDFFKAEFEKKFERIKNFRPYQHPSASFLSAKSLWDSFAPSLALHCQALVQKKEIDLQAFSLLCSLYLDQTKIPPDALRQILYSQQEQFSWLPKDPFLEKGDLSLFGFNTMEDWLGKRFLMLIAETVLNGSALASSQGYKISLDEARASMKANLRQAVFEMSHKELSEREIEQIYHRQVNGMHWNEQEVVETWSKVLLFRKYFQDFGQHMIVDSMTLEKAAKFASEAVSVDLFQLPAELGLNNFRDLLKLQIYLDAVAPLPMKKTKYLSLNLPAHYVHPKEIEKTYPELVESKYDIELQEVSLTALTEHVSLKETYAWQLNDVHWDKLKSNFPVLQGRTAANVEDRHEILAGIPVADRAAIDFYTKKMIVQEHPEWLEEAFTKASKKRVVFGLRANGGVLPFKGDVDREKLKECLDSSLLGSTFAYTPDGEHHYRVTIHASPRSLEIISFATAREDGTLDLLLNRYLMQVYPEVRKKHPALFALKEGGFKPLKEVQDLVGAEAFAELLHRIEEESKQHGVVWSDQMKHSLDLYARYRFMAHVYEARAALSNGSSEKDWIVDESSTRELSTQWHLIKETKTLKRKEATAQRLEKLFDEQENIWSQVQTEGSTGPYFYHVRQKTQPSVNTDAVVGKTRELLSLDAQRMLFVDLLDKTSSKGLMSTSKDFLEGVQEDI